ncbi:WSC domain-containing protein [Ephemerocybe angulata]|uniref:WSC domain-containing protein n=1 Tax=Ephemerocybe angulata TaxID=980116 RepID=A0A8H6IJ98_9AGAR|nr:WSC domain-containing protein [Tulosesus angulatus]
MFWHALVVGALTSKSYAMLRFPCSQLVTERFDPLVTPGQVSPHVHQIVGGNAFNLTMDPSLDLPNLATCTTCRFKEDKSNYWTAVMYFKHENGSFMRVPQIPNHFTGQSYLKYGYYDIRSWALTFRCWDTFGSPVDSFALPDRACNGGIRSNIFFPSCWDGKHLDSPDHKSHMAFMEGDVGPDGIFFRNSTCPSTHPVRVPMVFYEIVWDTKIFNHMWPKDGSQPFVLSMGDPTGLGHHGDYLFGWEGDSLQRAMDVCTDVSGRPADCASELTVLTDEEINSCKLPPMVNENVEGEYLSALPGCNPLQEGPQSATMVANCNAVSTTEIRPTPTPSA